MATSPSALKLLSEREYALRTNHEVCSGSAKAIGLIWPVGEADAMHRCCVGGGHVRDRVTNEETATCLLGRPR
jgi:hypothetical protein